MFSILATLAILWSVSTTGLAQMSSTNYRSSATTMSSSGGPMASANFQTSCTTAQPSPIMVPGMDPYSDNYGLLPGFW